MTNPTTTTIVCVVIISGGLSYASFVPWCSVRWPELMVSKWPCMRGVFVGHEGHHAVLLAEDGAAYFVGTARRGEDADTGQGHLNYLHPLHLQ